MTYRVNGTGSEIRALQPLTVQDGSTTVSPVDIIDFTSGATVTQDLTDPKKALIAVSGGGSSAPGALIDNLVAGLITISNNTITYLSPGNTVYDDGASAYGTAFIQSIGTHGTGFKIPTGGAGRYDIAMYLFYLATTTSFGVTWGFYSETQSNTGSYIEQVKFNAGDLAHYSGMSNSASGTAEAANSVIAQGIPLVVGDQIVFWTKQNSGSNKSIDRVAYSIRKVG